MNPSEQKTMVVRRTVFDLDAFEDVLLIREVPVPEVSNLQEALTFFGNDQSKLVAAINDGLREVARESARKSADGWFVADEKNPNELTDKVFTGVPADPSGVRQTIMTLAKTVFGYTSGRNQSEETKKKNAAAKEKAESMVKNVDDIREGLKAAALDGAE